MTPISNSYETTQRYTPGTVVRYEPDPSRHSPRWCREGTAVANERGALADTYWGSGCAETHILNAVEIDSTEVLFHLDDYDELDRYRPNRQHWETFAPADRQCITSQHGLQRRFFLRKNATADLATQIANAQQKVIEAEDELRSTKSRLEWARDDLAELTGIQHPSDACLVTGLSPCPWHPDGGNHPVVGA